MMPFALSGAILLLAVLAAVAVPLLRGATANRERRDYDRAVYRDQLQEVDRDLARGTITAAEAGAARLEIQRRLLAADSIQGTAPTGMARSPRLAAFAVLFLLSSAGWLYWRLGTPMMAGAPYRDRPTAQTDPRADPGPPGNEAANQDAVAAEQRLAEALRANPSDATAWIRHAQAVSDLGEWEKAAESYRRAIELGAKGVGVQSNYGEALVLAARGVVAPGAQTAFAAALAGNPKDAIARYYLALADGQAGDTKKAIDAWLMLAAEVPTGSPMRDEIGHRIAEAARAGGFPAPALPPGLPMDQPRPGPTPEQIAAAEKMTPAERERMIDGMIEALAAKLRTEPNDLEGWLRLGSAHAVRGDAEKAANAFDNAMRLKPEDVGIKLLAVRALLSRLAIADPFPPKAVALLREVAAVEPEAPEVLWYLGLAAAHERHLDDARGYWSKLLAQLPAGGEDHKMVAAAIGALKGP